MILSEAQYRQLTGEFGMSPERVRQLLACTPDDLADIIEAERLAGTIATVSGWQRFLQILREAKEVAEDVLPIFQVAATAATLLPLL